MRLLSHAEARKASAAHAAILALLLLFAALPAVQGQLGPWPPPLAESFQPATPFKDQFGSYATLLRFADGRTVTSPEAWQRRREEIRLYWMHVMGAWPELLREPKVEVLETKPREHLTQRRVRIQIAPDQSVAGYLLIPDKEGPFPAVLIPYYEPETSIGISEQKLRDFGYRLAQRGFVTLSIGSPGGDARQPTLGQATCQPLSFLAYVAANGHTALSQMKEVDARRIGIVGHSYGGKWAMFAACLYDKFACGVWSDPGIVFDEHRPNVNYWEPWYLGLDPTRTRRPGVPSPENPRTGAYKTLFESRHDLHELLALMAPRPFLVSGGSEDTAERWQALNRVTQVYQLLGVPERVGLTTRPEHSPNAESNEQIYAFFEACLKRRSASE